MEERFVFREAAAKDIPALAALHARTWAETYADVKNPPTAETRKWQWEAQFNSPDKNWFCIVIENEKEELIGFAKGLPYQQSSLPQFSGELNKFYILKKYQKQGLGTRLFELVVRQFISMGINSMVLFGETQNPYLVFYDKMGGQKLYAKNGEFHGGYGWSDLNKLAVICQNN